MSEKTVTVEFVQNAQVAGRGYLKGQTATLDEQTANAYVQVGQAKLVEGGLTPKQTAKRKTAKRGGTTAETASGKKGEQR